MGNENKIMSIFTKVMDAVILGVLWLMCSIPVITLGAASSALYYAFHKCVRQDRGSAWKSFFEAFRCNFRQATLLWLVQLGMIAFTYVDYQILNAYSKAFPFLTVLAGCMIAAFVFLILWGLYVFAYISRFDCPWKEGGKIAAWMVISNPLRSLALLAVYAVLVMGAVPAPYIGILAPAVYIFAANRLLEGVFRNHMSDEDLKKEKFYLE